MFDTLFGLLSHDVGVDLGTPQNAFRSRGRSLSAYWRILAFRQRRTGTVARLRGELV